MLYIFHVDTGTTITFDIKLALQSVLELKEAIERECGVSTDHQVLLMSGGESFEGNARVCSYSAGTDTNPIYLFSKAAIASQVPPAPSLDYGSDIDLQSQVDASLAMSATYQTIVARAQLSQHFCSLAREQARICERLVHDQHLQQQGWAAVVANLEDIMQTFHARAASLRQNFALYLEERQRHVELLTNFSGDLQTLAKIPILPALRAQADCFLTPEERDKEATVAATTTLVGGGPIQEAAGGEQPIDDPLTLLKWISAKDNQSTLEQVAELCSRGIEQFDEGALEAINAEIDGTTEAANQHDMKQIKGLGERLFALEQLMAHAKKIVVDQSELAQGFHQNKTRVSNLNDDSVLPDLCDSHRRQLLVMLQNHNQLRGIRRRCTKAKEELSVNIHRRLKWIVYVENKMVDVDSKLLMYHESLRRLRRQLEILRQIHLAPQMYVTAVAEVVRRRTFSQAFLAWASDLARQLLAARNEELERRREFQAKFEGHFLNALFPGLEDVPPPFATEAPQVFDEGLPKLTPEDMEALRHQLPNFTFNVSTTHLSSITQFFLSKSLCDCELSKGKESTSMPVDTSMKNPEGVRPPLLGDRLGCESETDTEEFEKIGQAAMDSKVTSYDSTKQQHAHRQKQLEENLVNTREEVDRLRDIIRNLKSIAGDSIGSLRAKLDAIKEQVQVDCASVLKLPEEVNQVVAMHTYFLREHEQALTVDHELELSDIKKMLQAKDEQLESINRLLLEKEAERAEQDRLIRTMRQSIDEEQAEIRNLQTHYRQLEERLEQSQSEKADAVKALKEESEKLQQEHKADLEAIRSRFKLMAASTMERSPSDSSLEKIERADVIELINHETILAQVKKDFETERDEAVREAVERKQAAMTQELEMAYDIIKKLERKIEICRQQELALIKECSLYESQAVQLAKAECIVRNLEIDKAELERKIITDQEQYNQQEGLVRLLEVERDELRRELDDQTLEMSTRTNIDLDEALKTSEQSENDDVKESETKKVKLEVDDITPFSCRIEILEADNKRLNSELKSTKESKDLLESKIEALENEKVRLEAELVKERSKRNLSAESVCSTSIVIGLDVNKDLNASTSVFSETSSGVNRLDAATSTERIKREGSSSSHSICEQLSKSTVNLMKQGQITFMSCNPGDVVLVIWDQLHRNYILLQDSNTYYFLNSDCIPDLDLNNLTMGANGLPTKLHVVAEVVDKEYCFARKSENRYRVPQGTKFFRVRVKPWQKLAVKRSETT